MLHKLACMNLATSFAVVFVGALRVNYAGYKCDFLIIIIPH